MKLTVANYPELVAQWHPTKNGELKPSNVSYGSAKKIWWKCPVTKDHEWQVSPNARTSLGRGCPYCTGQKACSSNCLATICPDLISEWHPIKNGDITPYNIVAGSNKKVWWKCPIAKDHEWQASPSGRKNGNGCPCCRGLKVVASNCVATLYPQLLKEWHPTKNGDLTLYDFVKCGGKRVWWQCENGHEWESPIMSRTWYENGCPICSNKLVSHENCFTTTHPELAKEWHPTKNGKITPHDIVVGSGAAYWWVCDKGHEWKTIIKHRRDGSGCPYCSNQLVCADNCLATTHPDLAKEWHPTKNKITPNDVVGGSGQYAWWICNKGHEWKSLISHRGKGSNCPVCNESKGEKRISKYLRGRQLLFKPQYKFSDCKNKKQLPFDFGVEFGDRICLIEYQGHHHYIPVDYGVLSKPRALANHKKTVEHDGIKKQYCIDRGIPLLEIPYWDFDKIEQLIENFLEGNEGNGVVFQEK